MTGARGHAPAPPRAAPAPGAGRRGRPGSRPRWRSCCAPRSSPRSGSPASDPRAEPVGEGDRRLGEQPAGRAWCRRRRRPMPVADDVGDGGVEVLVEVGADLGEVRVADAEQGELLPEQPVVGELLVAGQAPVEERRRAVRRGPSPAPARARWLSAAETAWSSSAPRRRAAPWCRSGSAAGRRRPRRCGRSRPSARWPGRRARCSRRRRRGSGCAPPRRPARAGSALLHAVRHRASHCV